MNQLAFSKASYLRERLLADDHDLDERTLLDTIEGLGTSMKLLQRLSVPLRMTKPWPKACVAGSRNANLSLAI